MAEPLVISALKRKRARISGALAEAEKRCEAMRLHLTALDQTLRIFGYEGDPADIAPVRPVRRLFRRGEIKRTILDAQRAADGPVDDADLVARIMAAKGWDVANADLRRTVIERVKAVRRQLAP